jgi:hypothetical protein
VRSLLVLLVLLAPALAAAERVVTRSGAVYEGEARFEGDYVIVRREDGSQVRILRSQVDRIELSRDRAVRPRHPPPPPTPPPSARRFAPPSPPRLRSSAAFSDGAGLSFGYKRGFSVGAEWQRHVHRSLALGLSAQLGVEPVDPGGGLVTWGVNGRFYAGTTDRFVGEIGLGLNLAKVLPCQGVSCPDFVRSVGPRWRPATST